MLDVRSGLEVASLVMGGDNAQQSDGDWAAVAAALRARRDEQRLTQQKLAAVADVSVATVQELERGLPRQRQARTLAAICRALDWPTDHLDRVLRGAPTEDLPSSSVEDDVVADLRKQVRELGDEVRQLAEQAASRASVDEIASEITEVRGIVSLLQVHLRTLYDRVGQPYPEFSNGDPDRRRNRKSS